jgi:fumarate reductase subunit C
MVGKTTMIEQTRGLKLYRRPMPRTWWLQNRRYLLYMLREVSSIFMAIWVILLLMQIAQLGGGRQAYQGFVDGVLRSPAVILFSLVTFCFALLHSVTWHQIAGVVQVVRVGERQLPPRYVTAGAFAAWLIATVIIGAVILGP